MAIEPGLWEQEPKRRSTWRFRITLFLLGAVLGLIGATEPTLMWACHPGMHGAVGIPNHC